MNKIKRLFLDIETSPNLGFFWRSGYDIDIQPNAIVSERKVITIAWKWEGERKIYVLKWDKDQDDKSMLREFLKVCNVADEIVAFYGDRFDIPWLRTRMLIHGFDPIPPWKTVDPKSWASRHYYFNSCKLDYIASILGFGHKLPTGFDLWKDIILKRCPVALNKMAKYNARDVDLLEKVYHKLKFCVKPKTHAGVANGLDKWTCPRDGSINVHLSKSRVSSSGTKTYQMQCQECGGYFQISQTAYDSYQKFLKNKKKK